MSPRKSQIRACELHYLFPLDVNIHKCHATMQIPEILLEINLFIFFNSVHPFMPLLATSSGQRQFLWPGDRDGDSASDGEGGEAVMSPQENRQDNTLSVWWAGPLGPATEESQSEAVVEA